MSVRITFPDGRIYLRHPCPDCDTQGIIKDSPSEAHVCKTCLGIGYIGNSGRSLPPVRLYVTHHRLARTSDQRGRPNPDGDGYTDAYPPEANARIQFTDVPYRGFNARIVWIVDDRQPLLQDKQPKE